jgi:hypothetical protein
MRNSLNEVPGMEALQGLLNKFGLGPIRNTGELVQLLVGVWDDFDGSDDGGMRAEKLVGRLESVEWNPPNLDVAIERHGGTANGSTRAEVQHWRLDLGQMTAEIVRTSPRQLYMMALRITTKMMRDEVEELAPLIEAGSQDERLRWKRDGRVHVVVSEIIGGGFQRREAGRRKRMRGVLEEALGRYGWVHEGCNVFRKVKDRDEAA